MQWPTGVPVLHNLGLPMVRYRASGTDVPGFFWCGCHPMRSDGLPAHCRAIDFFFSVHDPDSIGVGPTSPLCPLFSEWHTSKRSTMDLSERELEYHCHLDDLLPPPTNASTLAASARSRDAQDIHQYRRDAR